MIYVDKLTSCLKGQDSLQVQRYGTHIKWSHLFTDSNIEELHQFALKIGLKLEWFQNSSILPHYDIVESKRRLSGLLGAQEIDLKFFLKNKIKRL